MKMEMVKLLLVSLNFMEILGKITWPEYKLHFIDEKKDEGGNLNKDCEFFVHLEFSYNLKLI